jgi:hypothetical protein
LTKLSSSPPSLPAKKLETLEHNLQSLQTLNKLAIPTLEGFLFFDISHIIHLEAQSNYTAIYFTDYPKLIASRTLKDFEDLLPAEISFRPQSLPYYQSQLHQNVILKVMEDRLKCKTGILLPWPEEKKMNS